MSVASLQFLAGFLVLAAVFPNLPSWRWRQGVLAACNTGFAYLIIPNPASWAVLAAFLLSGYAVALLLRRYPSRLVLAGYLAVLVVAFVVVRKYEFVTLFLSSSLLAHPLSIVGLSYMLFRQIQLLVDAMQGQIERTTLFGFLNYQLNLFTLLSGPIQRYQDFLAQWEELGPVVEDGHLVRMAYLRILMGFIKLSVIAAFFFTLYQRSAGALEQAGAVAAPLGRAAAIGHFLGVLYFYPMYLYLNFSGYCDIVIAGASLIGLKLPENFDRPYLARNVIDYWTRWHRTLGFWIRDYLFLPLYKEVATHWPSRAESLAFLCYFVAFFIAGVWHGSTTNFVIYGLLQAVGVSAAKLWERHIIKRRGRAGLKEYLGSPAVRAAAIVGTVNFACLSLLFFPVDVHTTVRMLETVWRAVA